MSGIAPNPLNAISKVYLEQVAEAKVEPPKEKLKTDRNMFNIPKDEQQAARERLLAKSAAKRKAAMEALDPVGQEDADIDNDGDTDKSDKYLHKRRKAISAAMKKRMKEERELAEIHKQAHMPHEVPDKNLKGLVAKAVKRIDTDVDGDTDNNDKAKGELGEFVPGVGNKRLYSSTRTKTVKESLSNWRQDLTEIMDDEIDSKKIKEKKVNNKIKINPEFKEALEEIGATLIEMVEIDEFDFVVESVYDELIEEGYSEDEVEFGIETALNTLDEGYYDSAVAASKAAAKTKGETPKVSMKDRLKSAAKKAIVGGARAAGRAVRAGAAVAAAPGRAKRKASSIADRVKKAASAGYQAGRGPEAPSAAHTKTRSSSTYRSAGVGRKEKIGEETEIEEGIGMTMAKAVGNPPALSKRMKLKQALLNREIKKNAAANKKKSYSGKAAVSEAVKGQDTEMRKAAAADRKSGEKRLPPSSGKGYADQQKQSISYMDKLTKKNKNVVGLVTKEEAEQLDEMPFQVMGSPDGKKEKKIGKPVKSKKYADARAAELADTHKATGGKYRSQYVEDVEQVEEGLTDLQRRRYLGRKPGESKERLKKSNERKDKKAALAAMMKQYKGMKAGIYSSYEPEGELVDEKLNMKKEKMGDVIKDFYKSDAPQFKGKSKEKRRQMAIAAKLTAERGGKRLGEGATEAPMSPQELALQKRKTMIDQMIAKKRQQALQKQKQV